MNERPILFSGAMVRGILDGRKTQTRRVITPQPTEMLYSIGRSDEFAPPCVSDANVPDFDRAMRCPYGAPGDRLWVRETWMPDPPINGWPGDVEWDGCGRPISGVPELYRSPDHCLYAATWEGGDMTWRPSIHMPRWAARIALEVTAVRVERVQDISEADAWAEGCDRRGYAENHDSAVMWFADLWNSINSARGYGWDANSWVWVVEFRRVNP